MTKIFLDEDVHPGLAIALQRRGVDAIHVRDLSREGKADEEQLAESIRLERAILSFNQKDFSRLHIEALAKGSNHFGIIIGPQMPLREALRRTLLLLQNIDDLRGNIWHL